MFCLSTQRPESAPGIFLKLSSLIRCQSIGKSLQFTFAQEPVSLPLSTALKRRRKEQDLGRKEGKTKLSRYNSFPATKVFRGLSSLSGTLTLPGEKERKGEFATPFLFYFCRKERRRGNRIKKKTLSFRLSAFPPFCHKVPSRSFLFPPLEAKKTQPKGKKKIGAKKSGPPPPPPHRRRVSFLRHFYHSLEEEEQEGRAEKLSFFVYFSLAVSKYAVQNAQNCRYDAKTF